MAIGRSASVTVSLWLVLRPELLPKLLFTNLRGAHDRVLAVDEVNPSRADLGYAIRIGNIDKGNH